VQARAIKRERARECVCVKRETWLPNASASAAAVEAAKAAAAADMFAAAATESAATWVAAAAANATTWCVCHVHMCVRVCMCACANVVCMQVCMCKCGTCACSVKVFVCMYVYVWCGGRGGGFCDSNFSPFFVVILNIYHIVGCLTVRAYSVVGTMIC